MSILKEAKALIKNPENWCVQSYARDKHGSPVMVGDSRAVKFCSLGALCIVGVRSANAEKTKAKAYLNTAAKRIAQKSMIQANDHVGHEKVMEIFDLAICMEECENEHTAKS